MVLGLFLHLNWVDYYKFLGFLPGPEPPPLLLQLFYLFEADVGYADVWSKFCTLEIFAWGVGSEKIVFKNEFIGKSAVHLYIDNLTWS